MWHFSVNSRLSPKLNLVINIWDDVIHTFYEDAWLNIEHKLVKYMHVKEKNNGHYILLDNKLHPIDSAPRTFYYCVQIISSKCGIFVLIPDWALNLILLQISETTYYALFMKIHDAVLSLKWHENILRCMRGIKIFVSSWISNRSGKTELERLIVVNNLVYKIACNEI